MIGAQERTRTSTPLRELAPEASASANSATWAFGAPVCSRQAKTRLNQIAAQPIVCQRSTLPQELLTRAARLSKLLGGAGGNEEVLLWQLPERCWSVAARAAF